MQHMKYKCKKTTNCSHFLGVDLVKLILPALRTAVYTASSMKPKSLVLDTSGTITTHNLPFRYGSPLITLCLPVSKKTVRHFACCLKVTTILYKKRTEDQFAQLTEDHKFSSESKGNH